MWALTRIESPAARAAVVAALDDGDPSVRQAAARAAGLHRDPAALARLEAIVGSDEPRVRREAATALGRIGDAGAVPALFRGLNGAESDRFLEHAMIFALIRIGDRPGTLKGLALASTGAKRGALVALDQMDGGQLTPEVVTPFLAPADPLLQQTALWVIGHHGDWGRAMVDFFGQWLAQADMDDMRREELKTQLLAFAGDESVQELVGRSLADAATPRETRLLLLEVIAQAAPAPLPPAWVEPLRLSLEASDESIVRQAVATLRALPLDKRPLAGARRPAGRLSDGRARISPAPGWRRISACAGKASSAARWMQPTRSTPRATTARNC